MSNVFKNRNKIFVLSMSLVILFSFFARGYSSQIDCASEEAFYVKEFRITGLVRTKENVIHREISGFLRNKICESSLTVIKEKINRLGLFYNVSISSAKSGLSDRTIDIEIEEKWTTIPIVKLLVGGGVSQMTLGVFDPNLYGQFFEAGTFVEYLGGAYSGVIWMKQPRLWDEVHSLDAQIWSQKRIRVKYDQSSADLKVKNAFLQDRKRLYLLYSRSIEDDKKLRFGFDVHQDDFSLDIVPDSIKSKAVQALQPPINTSYLLSIVGYDWGQIDGDASHLNGKLFSATFSWASPLRSNLNDFSQLDLQFIWHTNIVNDLNFSQRLLSGTTNANVVQYWNYLGGLDRVRGYADNRFSGRDYILSNSEMRYLFYKSANVQWQSVGFIDLATIGENVGDLSTLRAASYGAGLRFILPKVYRFVVRLDYAKPIIENDDMNWSFGVQHFF